MAAVGLALRDGVLARLSDGESLFVVDFEAGAVAVPLGTWDVDADTVWVAVAVLLSDSLFVPLALLVSVTVRDVLIGNVLVSLFE